MNELESGPTRREVAMAGHRGDEATARAGLSSAQAVVRATALGALERLGVLDDSTLTDALVDPSPLVRRRAAELASSHPDVDLLASLGDADSAVVEAAAWAHGEREFVDDRALFRLIELATDARLDALARESAVAALGAIGDDRGLDAVLTATTDRPAIRRRAVLALAPFLDDDHPRAAEVAAALDRAKDDRDWQVRQAAEDLLPAE